MEIASENKRRFKDSRVAEVVTCFFRFLFPERRGVMKGKLCALWVLISIVMFFGTPISRVEGAQSPWTDDQGQINRGFLDEYVPGELLVKFKEGASRAEVQGLHSALGAIETKRIEPLEVRRIKLPLGLSVEQAITLYQMDPNVEYAEPNYIVHLAAMPTDPDFSLLWGLHNTGQNVNGVTGTPDADIDAPEAWDITTGSSDVIIAVIDSGVALNHPDLAPNIWTNAGEIPGNVDDDDGNGYVDDIYGWDFYDDDGNPEDYNYYNGGHGTHVAGTIAALGNGGGRIAGVNWNAKIMALRFIGSSGEGLIGDAAEAIIYAVDNGATIINLSWGIYTYSPVLYDAVSYASTNNVLFVAAAGSETPPNDNDGATYSLLSQQFRSS